MLKQLSHCGRVPSRLRMLGNAPSSLRRVVDAPSSLQVIGSDRLSCMKCFMLLPETPQLGGAQHP